MAVIRSKPRSWFWARDIEPDQVAGLAMPGMRLQRLVSYRRGAQADRRFAAFYYDDDGATAPSRLAVAGERSNGTGWSVHVDVDADDVARRLEQQHGYPLDLDAVGPGLSVRFAVIAAA